MGMPPPLPLLHHRMRGNKLETIVLEVVGVGGAEGWGASLELIGTIMQLDLGVYGILETKMMGFVMGVIGKWSKVVVLAPEPAFYYLCCYLHPHKFTKKTNLSYKFV